MLMNQHPLLQKLIRRMRPSGGDSIAIIVLEPVAARRDRDVEKKSQQIASSSFVLPSCKPLSSCRSTKQFLGKKFNSEAREKPKPRPKNKRPSRPTADPDPWLPPSPLYSGLDLVFSGWLRQLPCLYDVSGPGLPVPWPLMKMHESICRRGEAEISNKVFPTAPIYSRLRIITPALSANSQGA